MPPSLPWTRVNGKESCFCLITATFSVPDFSSCNYKQLPFLTPLTKGKLLLKITKKTIDWPVPAICISMVLHHRIAEVERLRLRSKLLPGRDGCDDLETEAGESERRGKWEKLLWRSSKAGGEGNGAFAEALPLRDTKGLAGDTSGTPLSFFPRRGWGLWKGR